MPKVSIIMPTYNRAWIIKRAIDSVLNQSFTDFELIIIDDDSTDNTADVIKQISDQRVVYYHTDKNTSLAKVRNIGIDFAKGELISYLDTDNIWYPNFLEVMSGELTDDYLLAYCGQNMLLVDGSKTNLKVIGHEVRNEKYNPVVLLHDNYIDINAVFHKKEVFRLVGKFDENLKSLEDWDLFARIAVKYPYKIKHVRQVLGEYHYFLKESGIVTLENQRLTDEHVRNYFHLKKQDPNAQIVIDKIRLLLNQ